MKLETVLTRRSVTGRLTFSLQLYIKAFAEYILNPHIAANEHGDTGRMKGREKKNKKLDGNVKWKKREQ